MSKKAIDIPEASITIRKDGILHINIKVRSHYELEQMNRVMEARAKITKGKAYPILHTVTANIIPSEEILEHIAKSDRSSVSLADAFVIRSLTHRLLIAEYMQLSQSSKVPLQFFSSEAKAIEWLKEFVES
ncbi:MAG: hypothetical protein JKY54_06660 [Flavobacteriales bacterium]|nr:hypothetical protein [Flavobacteriales bacterium]